MDILNHPKLKITHIKGEKFNTAVLALLIIAPLKKETAAKNALLARILGAACEKLPNPADMARANEAVYGAVFETNIIKKGRNQIILLYLEILNKPELVDAGINFLNEVLFHPLTSGERFEAELFQREKFMLMEELNGKKDNKPAFARERLLAEMFKSEGLGVPGDGYAKDLEKVNSNSLYKAYKELLENSPLELLTTAKLPPRRQITETANASQSRLCIGFKSSLKLTSANAFSCILLGELLGGSGGILFESIREQAGLAYSVNGYFSLFGMCLIIETGIGKDSKDEAVKIILDSIKEVSNGEFSSKELRAAKERLSKSYSLLSDSKQGMIDFALTEDLLGTGLSIFDYIKGIGRVDRTEICQAAEALTADTIYFLQGGYEN